MTNVELVDKALDRYCQAMKARYGHYPDGFRVSTLARQESVSTEEMSAYLQQHKAVPAKRRYDISPDPDSPYGRQARWMINNGPGRDMKVRERNRKKAGSFVLNDSHKRAIRRYVFEVYPALRGTAADAQMDQVVSAWITASEAITNLAIVQLDAIKIP